MKAKKENLARKPSSRAEPSRDAKKRKRDRPDTPRPEMKSPGVTRSAAPQPSSDLKKEGLKNLIGLMVEAQPSPAQRKGEVRPGLSPDQFRGAIHR